MQEQFIWAEKYRPKTVKDTILEPRLKNMFQEFVDQKNIPNLILCGKSGVGKTTVAKAMLEELQADYIVINGSLDGNIDTLRVTIANFASSISFTGGRKYVILDEADFLNPNSTQPALRNFMETYSANCGFILTCNYKSKIIKELHSRCSVIDFDIPDDLKTQLSAQFLKRVVSILEQENVKCEDMKIVAQFVTKYFPDWRRILNELQAFSVSGVIDRNILGVNRNLKIEQLVNTLKTKEFDQMRIWVASTSSTDTATFYRDLFDNLPKFTSTSNAIANIISILAEYEYKEAFVANAEINRTAAVLSIAAECEGEWQ